VLFAVVYHGASPHLVRALRHARGRGITTICVTAAPGSPAARAADITLVMWGPDSHTAPEQFVSRVLTVAVVEALFAAMVWKRFWRDTTPSRRGPSRPASAVWERP
jgi:RpiR family transcriptional regulator, carbohydrate utilization regulator